MVGCVTPSRLAKAAWLSPNLARSCLMSFPVTMMADTNTHGIGQVNTSCSADYGYTRRMPRGTPTAEGRARGRRLKLARMKRYGTAEEAAKALKVKPVTYRSHENGYRAPWASLRDYADHFGVSYEWLAHQRGEMEPSPRERQASQAEELLSSLQGDLYVHALDYLRLLKKQQDRTG
jgi:transcriptional regulator with XRE-family HTH domain